MVEENNTIQILCSVQTAQKDQNTHKDGKDWPRPLSSIISTKKTSNNDGELKVKKEDLHMENGCHSVKTPDSQVLSDLGFGVAEKLL